MDFLLIFLHMPFTRRNMGIYHDLVFTEAIEQIEALVASVDAEDISNRLEKIAVNQDLAHACLMLLTMKAKGINTSDKTGVELANPKLTVRDLILPPGVDYEN